MIRNQLYSIFKRGSRTYFYCSLFFPADVKEDVFALYSFVRTADDFVDAQPQKIKEFKLFRKKFEYCMKKGSSSDIVIDSFVALSKKRKFDPQWIEEFLDVMEQDITKKKYLTLQETMNYMYGSAEVIGLMMAKILNLPKASYPAAQSLGRSMQYINFIRDIREDLQLGRTYFPLSELKKFGLTSLDASVTRNNAKNFKSFISAQIKKQKIWSNEGENGYTFIPKRYLIPIKTANDLYLWTARQILKNPLIVYEKKVKPSARKIVFTIIKNIFRS